jgi:hypothetical protein
MDGVRHMLGVGVALEVGASAAVDDLMEAGVGQIREVADFTLRHVDALDDSLSI